MTTLNLPGIDALNHTFRVYDYFIGHSTLYVEMISREQTQYLHFTNLQFFSGPMIWHNTVLLHKSRHDCLSLLRSMNRFDQLPDEIIKELFELFVFDGDRITIQIVCSAMEMLAQLPDHLRASPKECLKRLSHPIVSSCPSANSFVCLTDQCDFCRILTA